MDLMTSLPNPNPEDAIRKALLQSVTQENPDKYPHYKQNDQIFFATMYEKQQFNPLVLDKIVMMHLAPFQPFVSQFFKITHSSDQNFIYSRYSADLSPVGMGVRKVIGPSRAITRTIEKNSTVYKAAAVAMDWYFLKTPGGIEEYRFKLQGQLANLERSFLLKCMREMTLCPMHRKRSDERSQGMPHVRTVRDVMKNRAIKWGCLDKGSEYGLQEIIADGNAMFSQLMDPSQKYVKNIITSSSLVLTALTRSPYLVNKSVSGSDALRTSQLWNLPKRYHGVQFIPVPDMEPTLKNNSTETIFSNVVSLGSTLLMTNTCLNTVPPEKYTSKGLIVQAVDSVTNGWRNYYIIDALKSLLIFDKDGKFDHNVAHQIIDAYEDESQTSVWKKGRVKRTDQNMREALMFLKYVQKTRSDGVSKYNGLVPCYRVGDISKFNIDNDWMKYIYKTFELQFFSVFDSDEKNEIIGAKLKDILDKTNNTYAAIREKLDDRAHDFRAPTIEELSMWVDASDLVNSGNPIPLVTNTVVNKLNEASQHVEYLGGNKYDSIGIIYQRTAEAKKGETLMAVLAALYVLYSNFNVEVMEQWFENDILLPFGMRLSRPFETHIAQSAVLTNGQKLGYMNYTGISLKSFTVDTGYKHLRQDVDAEIAFTFIDRENMEYIPFVHFDICLGGKGYKIADQRYIVDKCSHNSDLINYVVVQNNSWFASLVSLNHIADDNVDVNPDVISMNGLFDPKHFVSEMEESEDFTKIRERPLFSGGLYFVAIGMFVNDLVSASTSMTMSFDEFCRYRLWNGYCCTTTTRKYNPETKRFTKKEKGCHILGWQIENVRLRDKGVINTEEYNDSNSSFNPYVPVGNSHSKRLKMQQEY